jgi:hypothetical protein
MLLPVNGLKELGYALSIFQEWWYWDGIEHQEMEARTSAT